MTSQEQFAIQGASVAACVIGRGTVSLLIFLDGPIEPALPLAQLGFRYCGLMTYKDGRPEVVSDPTNPDAQRLMCSVIPAFAEGVADRLRLKSAGDEVQWLENLYSLKDDREGEN
jgi:hypothetical protein